MGHHLSLLRVALLLVSNIIPVWVHILALRVLIELPHRHQEQTKPHLHRNRSPKEDQILATQDQVLRVYFHLLQQMESMDLDLKIYHHLEEAVVLAQK